MNQRSIGRPALVAVIGSVLLSATCQAVTLEWTFMDTGTWGSWPTLALDANGYPHFSYAGRGPYDGVLRYTFWNGSTWQSETVDDSEGHVVYSSVAVDSSGRPHIGYYSSWPEWDLKYAVRDGSTWNVQTIETEGDVGSWLSLELDTDDHPHISYVRRGPGAGLRYATWNGSTWDTQGVGRGGGYTSLALDSNDRPHISCAIYAGSQFNNLMHAAWDGSAWQEETVDSVPENVGGQSSVALDGNDRPHISYGDVTNNDLKYATWDGSAWDVQVVDSDGDVGRDSSLAVDANGHPHISYSNKDNNSLMYASWTGSTWDIEALDSRDGVLTSLVLDDRGLPHIGYRSSAGLSYAFAIPEPSSAILLAALAATAPAILVWRRRCRNKGHRRTRVGHYGVH